MLGSRGPHSSTMRIVRCCSASRTSSPNRRRPAGMKRIDRLQPPRLAFVAPLLGPHDRLPVRRQNETGAGIGNLHPIAAGLVDVEEKCLLDGVLVRTGFDVDAVLQKD